MSVALASTASAEPFDTAECVNAPNGVTSDVCIMNPGHTGVDRIVFDRPARRLPTVPGSAISTPLAATAMEASAVVRSTRDIVIVSANGICLTANDSPTTDGVEIPDVFRPDAQTFQGNSTLRLPASALLTSGSSIPAGTRVELFPGNFDPADSEDELLVVVAASNGRVSLVNPNGNPTWGVSWPWFVDASLATLRDVDVTDLDSDGDPDMMLLFPAQVVVLRSGATPTVEVFSVGTPTVPLGDPRVITARSGGGSAHKMIHVVDQPSPSGVLAIRSYAYGGVAYGLLASTSVTGIPTTLPTVTDVVDGSAEWGLVITLDGVRDGAPAPRGSMPSSEPYVGAVITLGDSAGLPVPATAEMAVVFGGASRALLRDLGPSTAGRHIDTDGNAVNGSDVPLDGQRDLLVLGDGARGFEVFDVGNDVDRIPRRLGVVSLFQAGASRDRSGKLRPTSQWRLASPLDDDVSDILALLQDGSGPGEFRDRTLTSFVAAHLDLGPESDLLTLDTTNGDLIILRPQPLPCAAFVTAVVHGHQGAAAQMTPLPPPAPQFEVDTSVDVGTAGATEYMRRINEARRPGSPSSMGTPDLCPARHVEVRGHWERQTGGVTAVPTTEIVGAGSLLTASRILAGTSQYQVGARILVDTDPVLGPHLGAINLKNYFAGSAILWASGLGREFSGVDPVWYQRSLVGLAFFPEFWPLLARRYSGLGLSTAFSAFAQASTRSGHAPVVVDLSEALDDTLVLVREHVDVCNVAVMLDLNGHSRGTPTFSTALDPSSSLATFPRSSRSRLNTSVHVNYIDAIDKTHAWTGIEWPWHHAGESMGDGFVRRHGNESISTFASSSYDPVGLSPSTSELEGIVNTRVDMTTNHYLLRGGVTPVGTKWDSFRPMTHSMSLPQGYERDLSFNASFPDFCATNGSTCAPYATRENSLVGPTRHAPMYFWAFPPPQGLPTVADQIMDPAQFSTCAQTPVTSSSYCTPPVECAPADVHARVHFPSPTPQLVNPAIDCSPTTSCTRPLDFCYASNSHLGDHIDLVSTARNAFPTTTEAVGWAPQGGPGTLGAPRSVFTRNALDEREFLPDFCGGGFAGTYASPADDFWAPPGLDTVAEELVEDWDFKTVANLVAATDDTDDLMRDEYLEQFPEIEQYVDVIKTFRWLDGVWVQDACVYAETNPCLGVTAEADVGHDLTAFADELTSAMVEGVDLAAVAALPEEDRLDGLFAQIDALRSGLTEQELKDISEYYLGLVSGRAVTTETYAQFPTTTTATISSPLHIVSRQHQDLLLRVDFQFTDAAGYLDVYLTGDSLIESRRISAAAEGLTRTTTTFQPFRTATIPASGLNDIIVLNGKGVNVYSVSVRPHRILESSNGRFYEFVQLRDGVSWDQARAVAMRSRYYGLPGRLADPVDATNVLALTSAVSPHIPVWVGAKKTPTDATFLNDDDVPVPANVFETAPPAAHDLALHAYIAPGDDLLSYRRNSVQIGDQQYGFVVEYDPLPPDPNCLDTDQLLSHWPLSAGDAGGPVVDVRAGTNLTIRTGAAARSVTPLAGTIGNALHFYGSTAFRSASAPTGLLNDFINGDGAVSLWIKPTSLAGTQVIFSIGGVLADGQAFPPIPESASKNVVFQLRRVGDELQVVWEYLSGTDVIMSTSGLDLVAGQTYQVVVSRYLSPISPFAVDVGIYVSKPGEGRVYEDAFFTKQRPTGTTSANAAVSLAGDWGTNMYTGAIDAVRVWREELTSVDAWMLFEGESMNDTCGY